MLAVMMYIELDIVITKDIAGFTDVPTFEPRSYEPRCYKTLLTMLKVELSIITVFTTIYGKQKMFKYFFFR